MAVDANFQKSLNDFSAALNTSVTEKVAAAVQADNATAVGGQTQAQLVAGANGVINPHIANTSNPHGTTAALAGTYDKPTLDNLFRNCVQQGILPIDQFGDYVNGTAPVTLNASSLTVRFQANVPLFMAGTAYSVGDVSDFSLTANNPAFFYAQLVNGVASIRMRNAADLAESATTMYLGQALFSSTTGPSTDISLVTRIGGYRVSSKSAGTAIPVSLGNPATPATLAWQ